ncbi:trehalase family glycosidase [Jiangella alkaliphila]|uniref:Alpha,alpha-trehalase n=1 Tax=Jiangella alkaliphila TaxID=419479 RepID=A0A1H2K4D9_9ACTN|nr:trehalase family glycosidase [Jiangella alkaliphila]SDU63311.1 alpha,alpha-trehalase [Jiangella alkaliphila]
MERPAVVSTIPGTTTSSRPPDEERWANLDRTIGGWWDSDAVSATEERLVQVNPTAPPEFGTLLFLPFPYVPPSGSAGTFTTMYAWDTDFTSRALLAHGRGDLVRGHLLNYLFMVSRFGYMPNANVTSVMSRSQTPLIADTVWRYHLATKDEELLEHAFPLLKQNYRRYWNAEHHQTPIGLATNRDLGDPYWPPELAAEAETGWDWTPIFGGDVRRCAPLITNCALVRYARALSLIAGQLGRETEAEQFHADAERRAELIRRYCWNEELGFFVEYDHVAQRQLPYLSSCAFYALWTGVATPDQAGQLADRLPLFEHEYGLACTDREYPDPHPDAYPDRPPIAADVPPDLVGGQGQLQWMYPAGWAPEHLIAAEGLDAYGYTAAARRVSARFLRLLVDRYHETGHLWEKYNVVDGTLVLPNSRCGNVPLRGWTATAVVLLGRYVYRGDPLAPTPVVELTAGSDGPRPEHEER